MLDEGRRALVWPSSVMVRAGIVAMCTLAALWLTLGVTATLTIGRAVPEAALGWWPWGALSNAALANRLIESDPQEADYAQVQRLGERALRREPGNVAALRALGVRAAAAGDAIRAQRLFAFAESRSRRDLPTQLWLIEQAVQSGDIDRALRHYDKALRTAPSSRATLLPILAQAAGDPAIGQPLAKMVARRPVWWPDLLAALLDVDGPSDGLAAVMATLRLDPKLPQERDLLSRALFNLARDGQYHSALQLYLQARQHPPGVLVRNTGLATGDLLGPFEWEAIDEVGFGAVSEPRPDVSGGTVFTLLANPGRSGVVARQLLVLLPGRYSLSLRAGNIAIDPDEGPIVALRCIGSERSALTELKVAAAPPSGVTLKREFVLGQDSCAAQELTIAISAADSISAVAARPWIGGIAIQPAVLRP